MDGERGPLESEDFIEQTRDVLSHLYDYAYLVCHPLVARFRGSPTEDSTVAVQRVRKLLLNAVEQLRPTDELPPDDPAWRPYAALYQRYVLGKESAELEGDLSLGKRQLQREQRRGLVAVAAALWDQQTSPEGAAPPPADHDTLQQEIDRTNTQRQVFDAGEHLLRALVFAKAIADSHELALSAEPPADQLLVVGNPVAFRQALLSSLSIMARSAPLESATVSLAREGRHVVSVWHAVLVPGAGSASTIELPTTLVALVASQHGEVQQATDARHWWLRMRLPASDWVPVIAVVEDNKDLVSLLARYMSAHGYRLVDAGASSGACERIAEIRPDAIVLDVMMRDVDGWEVLQQIRTHPQLAHVPVAVCSVLNEPELARCLGANAYLHKPIRPVQFLECVASLLG